MFRTSPKLRPLPPAGILATGVDPGTEQLSTSTSFVATRENLCLMRQSTTTIKRKENTTICNVNFFVAKKTSNSQSNPGTFQGIYLSEHVFFDQNHDSGYEETGTKTKRHAHPTRYFTEKSEEAN